MHQYLELLRHVRTHGVHKATRGMLKSTGEKVSALSSFGHQMRFDLKDGFPLVTTKPVSFGMLAHELRWFLRGDTNVAYLREHKIPIWDSWADPETGELGPIYGKQWRRWQAPDGSTVDQIANLLRDIDDVKRDPSASAGRRLIVSAWNPADMPKKAPPACHTMFQFNITNGELSCQLYQRSADMLLGVPFNVASYALLTHLIAHVTGLRPGSFIHAIGDAHVYDNHLDQVDEQLSREPRPLPQLAIDPRLTNLDDFEVEHLTLTGYQPHPKLDRAEVAV